MNINNKQLRVNDLIQISFLDYREFYVTSIDNDIVSLASFEWLPDARIYVNVSTLFCSTKEKVQLVGIVIPIVDYKPTIMERFFKSWCLPKHRYVRQLFSKTQLRILELR